MNSRRLGIFLLCSHSVMAWLFPGQLRRNLIGSPSHRFQLPQEAVDSLLLALQERNPQESLPHLARAVRRPMSSLSPLSLNNLVSKKIPSVVVEEEKDCLAAQQELRHSKPISRFIYKITPSDVSLDSSDREAQEQWMRENASMLHKMRQTHGCVFFQGWDILKDQDGLNKACVAMQMKVCEDPAQILRPRPALDKNTYEASNNPIDASTYIGLHNEATPGIKPESALFACFKAAETGGEFLLCDGRRVLRDIDPDALYTMQSRRFKAVFTEFPLWVSSAPGPIKYAPFADILHKELVSLGIDLASPTNEYILSYRLGEKRNKSILALTSKPYSPVFRHTETGEPFWGCNLDAGHRDTFRKRNPGAKKEGAFTTDSFDIVYGNGEAIEDKVLDCALAAMKKNTKAIKMNSGDGVFLDNQITMHGRKPFTGKRKHAVVWAEN